MTRGGMLPGAGGGGGAGATRRYVWIVVGTLAGLATVLLLGGGMAAASWGASRWLQGRIQTLRHKHTGPRCGVRHGCRPAAAPTRPARRRTRACCSLLRCAARWHLFHSSSAPQLHHDAEAAALPGVQQSLLLAGVPDAPLLRLSDDEEGGWQDVGQRSPPSPVDRGGPAAAAADDESKPARADDLI